MKPETISWNDIQEIRKVKSFLKEVNNLSKENFEKLKKIVELRVSKKTEGSMPENYCLWTPFGNGEYYTGCCIDYTEQTDRRLDGFDYCPFCGKKIDVLTAEDLIDDPIEDGTE